MSKKAKKNNNYEEFFNNTSVYTSSPIKTLLLLYKGNWGKVSVASLIFLIKHSPMLFIPLFTANIINIVSQPAKHNINELWFNLGIMLVLLIQNIPMHTLFTKYFSEAVRFVESGLRSTLIRKLQQLSMSYHKDFQSGKLQSKIIRDVESIEFLCRQLLNTYLPAAVNIITALVITISRSLTVTLFYLLTIPFSLLLIFFFRGKLKESNSSFRKEIEEMSSRVTEMVEMIPVTRAHGLESIAINRVDSQLKIVQTRGLHLDIINAVFGSSSWFTFQLFQVLCLIFTGFLAYKGKIPVGDVVLYQGYFGTIVGNVSQIINVYPSITKGFESISSIGEIVLSRDIEDNKGKKKIDRVTGAFSFKDVSFGYNSSDELVLNNFNLDIKAGESIAFVGESGAGKTTILNLIIGFNKPTSGKIFIDSRDMSQLDLCSYRQFVSVVPQATVLFSGSIRDNITYGMSDVSDEKLLEVIDMANIREFIDKLPNGLDTMIGEHGGKLSGGQRQRIAIARALIRDPRIIVFDEATSALDNISEAHVQKAMKQLIKDRTTFIVAHRLSTIQDADRIAVIKNGSCAEIGTYQELLDLKGEFYKLKNQIV